MARRIIGHTFETMDSLLDRLITLLRRHTDTIPRRAVVADDSGNCGVCELRYAPDGSRECHVLSAVCEAVKAARGDRVISRDIPTLLADCIHSDDEALWTALCDDALCGLLKPEVVRAHFNAHPHDAVAFIHRFRAAHTPDQAARILKVFSMCVTEFGTKAHELFVTELYHNDGVAYLVAFAKAAKSLPAKVRMMALSSMGRQITDETMYRPLVRGLFIEHHPVIYDDVLAILMASPCSPVLGAMLDDPLTALRHTARSALKAPVPRRGPYLLALASLVTHIRDAVPSDALHDLHTLIHHTARETQDLEVVRAMANVVKALERDSLCGVMADAFTRVGSTGETKNLGSL